MIYRIPVIPKFGKRNREANKPAGFLFHRWIPGLLVLTVMVFAAACGDNSPASIQDADLPDATLPDGSIVDATSPDAEPLPPGITAIAPYEPVEPWDDLSALDPIIGDADYIGLGESVHTSGGFYGTKDRVIRYLVAEKGFRVVAVETPWVAADLVGEFVATGEGNSTTVLRNIFGVFADRHMRDLVEWLAAWNHENPDDPVAYMGFDIQQPWDDARLLRVFLDSAAPEDATAVHEPLLRCYGAPYDSADDFYGSGAYNDPIEPEDHEGCMQGVDAAWTWFETNDATLIASVSADEVALARLHLRGLEANQGTVWGIQEDNYSGGFESRDHGMADVFDALMSLRHPGERAAIWAHNLHIAERHDEINTPWNWPGMARSMGTFLSERHGDNYRALGIIAYQTFMNWPGFGDMLPTPTESNSIELMLHELGEPFLLVDLKFPGAEDPFFTPGEMYRSGSGSYSDFLVPADQFHGLFFLEVSPAMEALFW